MNDGSRTARIIDRVRAIPVGFVRTYGDIDPHAPRLGVTFSRRRTMTSRGIGSSAQTGASPKEEGNAHSSSRKASQCAATASIYVLPGCSAPPKEA